jgi:two-component system, NtrC family, nitrogen regulation response regulator GlnG
MAKALIVSGDDNARYLYEMAVTFQKIEVESVKTIKEAAAKILKSLPDLVIIDLQTNSLEDLASLNDVKKRLKNLPVIIMTELSSVEAKKQACVLGACHVLAEKEATLGNLIKKTRQTIKK